jgi:hypothetical protein
MDFGVILIPMMENMLGVFIHSSPSAPGPKTGMPWSERNVAAENTSTQLAITAYTWF